MFYRATALLTLAALVVLCICWAALGQPRRVEQPAVGRRCVGVSTATLRSQNPVITRVYRAYDDGTIETYDDGAPDARWTTMK